MPDPETFSYSDTEPSPNNAIRAIATLRLTRDGVVVERSASSFVQSETYENMSVFHDLVRAQIGSAVMGADGNTYKNDGSQGSIGNDVDTTGAFSTPEDAYPVIDCEGRKFAFDMNDWQTGVDEVTQAIADGENNPFAQFGRPMRLSTMGWRGKIKNGIFRNGCSIPMTDFNATTGVYSRELDISWSNDTRFQLIDDDQPDVDPVQSIYPNVRLPSTDPRYDTVNKYRYNYGDHWLVIQDTNEGINDRGVIHTSNGDNTLFGLKPPITSFKVYDSPGFTMGIEMPFGNDGTQTKTFYGIRPKEEMANEAGDLYDIAYYGFISTGNVENGVQVTDSPDGETINEHELKLAFVFNVEDNNYTDFYVPITEPNYETFIKVYGDGYTYNVLTHTGTSSYNNRVDWAVAGVSEGENIFEAELSDDGTQVLVTIPATYTGRTTDRDGDQYESYPRQRDYLRGKSTAISCMPSQKANDTFIGMTVEDADLKGEVEQALGITPFNYDIDGTKELILIHGDANLVSPKVIVEYQPNKQWPIGGGAFVTGHYLRFENCQHENGPAFSLNEGSFKNNGYLHFCFLSPPNRALQPGEYRFDINNDRIQYKPLNPRSSNPAGVIVSAADYTLNASSRSSPWRAYADVIFENCNFALGRNSCIGGAGTSRVQLRNCYGRNAAFFTTGPTVIAHDTIAENMVTRGFAVPDGSVFERCMILNAQNQSGIIVQCPDTLAEVIRKTVVRDCFFYMGATTHGQALSMYKGSWVNCEIEHNIFFDCKRFHSAQSTATTNPDHDRGTYLLRQNLFWLDELLYTTSAGQKSIAHQAGDDYLSPDDTTVHGEGVGQLPGRQQLIIERNTHMYNPIWAREPGRQEGYGDAMPSYFCYGLDNNRESQVWASNNIVSGFFIAPSTNHIHVDTLPEHLPWNNGHDYCSNYSTNGTAYYSSGGTGNTVFDWLAEGENKIENDNFMATDPNAMLDHAGEVPVGIAWENMRHPDGGVSLDGPEIRRIFEEKDINWHLKYPLRTDLTEPEKVRRSASGPFYPSDLWSEGDPEHGGGGGGGPSTSPGDYKFASGQRAWVGMPLAETSPGSFWDQISDNSKFWGIEDGPSGRGFLTAFDEGDLTATVARDAYLSYVNDNGGNQIRKVIVSVEIKDDLPDSSIYNKGDVITITWPDDASTYGLGGIAAFVSTNAEHKRVTANLWPFSSVSGNEKWPGENLRVTMEWSDI